jgi:hypothetical protein
MTGERVFVAPELIGLDSRERTVTRGPLRPSNRLPSHWKLRTPFVALLSLIMMGSDVMAEAHRLRRDAERRYPHLNFDT